MVQYKSNILDIINGSLFYLYKQIWKFSFKMNKSAHLINLLSA